VSVLDLLERIASDASASHGISIGDARKLVRLAMITVAVDMNIPFDQITAYIEAVRVGSDPRSASIAGEELQ
jgi:hypothetical protein